MKSQVLHVENREPLKIFGQGKNVIKKTNLARVDIID